MDTKRQIAVRRLFICACIAATVGAAGMLLLRLSPHGHTSSLPGTVRSTLAPPKKAAVSPTPLASPFSTATSSGVNKIDWDDGFARTTDYFEFVSKASLAALNGEGSAARDVSMALSACMPLVGMYGHSSSPEEALRVHWDNQAYAPQWLQDKARREFQLCRRFLTGQDAFANLPVRTGGYNSIRFWTDIAVADHDPVALSSQAAVTANTIIRATSPEAKAAAVDSAQVMIDQVIDSPNPAALFRIGQVLTDERVSNDPVRGFAISLAACNMGYDCSSSNAELFGACAMQGDCVQNQTYADVVRKSVGEGGYARAYEQAQEFEQALARGDVAAAHQFAQLNRVN
jgi:hypothetical protein